MARLSEEDCYKIAIKYKTIADWLDDDEDSYIIAVTKNWIEGIKEKHHIFKNQFIVDNLKQIGFDNWARQYPEQMHQCVLDPLLLDKCNFVSGNSIPTYQDCIRSCSDFYSFETWSKECEIFYIVSKAGGWLDDVRESINIQIKPQGKLYKTILANALMHRSYEEWIASKPSNFSLIAQLNWLVPIQNDFDLLSNLKLELNECKVLAGDYIDAEHWKENDPIHYFYAANNRYINAVKPFFLFTSSALVEDFLACEYDSLNFTSKKEWKTSSPGIYRVAKANKWLQRIEVGPINSLTKVRCRAAAERFSSISSWSEQSPETYEKSLNSNWIAEIAAHIASNNTKYFSVVDCLEHASSYPSLIMWKSEDNDCFNAAMNTGLVQYIAKKCFIHVDYETCETSAIGFEDLTEWQNSDPECFAVASKNNWLKQIATIMKNDDSAYASTGSLRSLALGTLESTAIDLKDLTNEQLIIGYGMMTDLANIFNSRQYRQVNNIVMVSTTTGENSNDNSLHALMNYARKYETLTHWNLYGDQSKLDLVVHSGLLPEIISCLSSFNPEPIDTDVQWDFDGCSRVASYFNTELEWDRNAHDSYSIALINGWVTNIVYENKMSPSYRKLTFEYCVELAKECKTLKEFRKKHLDLHKKTQQYNWLHLIAVFAQFPDYKPRTKKKAPKFISIASNAQRCSTIQQFEKHFPHDYNVAAYNGLLTTLILATGKPVIEKWTLPLCDFDAGRFSCIDDWVRFSPQAYTEYKMIIGRQ